LIAYADSGFLVSLYASDSNSALATSLVARAKPVFLLTPLLELEFLNALQLLVFRKQVTRTERNAIFEQFSLDRRAGVFRATPLTSEAWEKAAEISEAHTAAIGTRTLDVLHVAAAVLLKPDVFFTFDKRQAKLARAVRLKVAPI
jgi:predicted nucleic acid-binding protein